MSLTLGDLFTQDEFERARAIHRETGPDGLAERFATDIVTPVIARINAKSNVRNDPAKLATTLAQAVMAARRPASRQDAPATAS